MPLFWPWHSQAHATNSFHIVESLNHWSIRTIPFSFLQTQNCGSSSYSSNIKPLQRLVCQMVTSIHSDLLFNLSTGLSCTPNSFHSGYLHLYTITQCILPPYFNSSSSCCSNPSLLFIIITMIKISLYYIDLF